MSVVFITEQLLNGLGYGLMLFLIAAGLTLVFGIMDVMNLAHGSLFMGGAYIAAQVQVHTGSFALACLMAVILMAIIAVLVEQVLIRRLYKADHLVQVLATFGLILVADDLVKMIWGTSPMMANLPESLSGPVQLLPELYYPSYRLLIIGAGLVVALGLYLLVSHTRVGMLVRAGTSNRWMAELMGVRVARVFTNVFVLGAMLAALAGALMGPLVAVQIGMGEEILIPALVVIVIGGIGSVRGAFIASLMVGVVDIVARAFLPLLLELAIPGPLAADLGATFSALSMYVLMAAVLLFKPSGLFSERST
ncbi:branched-chain amino acid ABC transporter permease [Massilia niabensis]|uniref:Branched-chain amino acid ABC transporter permease n=1 Tax=Massilia niabensis TaxID=544910 RepID=A0ABW0L1V6_9BURK